MRHTVAKRPSTLYKYIPTEGNLYSLPPTSRRIYMFMYISNMPSREKPLEWIAGSHKDLMALPTDVRRLFGYAISLAQAGDQHDAAKVLKGFGGAGVLEVVEDDAGGTYRAVYTVKFEVAVFVLHCFQKKSKPGVATPREGMDIIRSCPAESGRGACKGATK